jgi:hypothetical protein
VQGLQGYQHQDLLSHHVLNGVVIIYDLIMFQERYEIHRQTLPAAARIGKS